MEVVMKKRLFVMTFGFFLILTVSACASTPGVARVGPDTQIDLSGRWNDTDARTVCNSLVTDCLNSERVSSYIRQFSAGNDGRPPTVILGKFTNNTSEHIDTSIISKQMEIAIVNSGMLEFAASGGSREELRAERDDQLMNASEATASAVGNEIAASLMLTGAIKMIEDRAGNTVVRSYFVSAELTNIETNVRLWMGENNDIKKRITRPRVRI
jgi:hypothetical protein